MLLRVDMIIFNESFIHEFSNQSWILMTSILNYKFIIIKRTKFLTVSSVSLKSNKASVNKINLDRINQICSDKQI